MDSRFQQRFFTHYTDVNNAIVPSSPAPQESDPHSKEVSTIDSGLTLLVDMLKRKRQRKKMTVATLARRAQVSVETVQKLEAYKINAIGLVDLISIGRALSSKLTVGLAPLKPKLPRDKMDILRQFDRLLRSPNCNPFIRKAPDNDHKGVLWDIVGDRKRNWLFVVASNPKKRVRFGAVTDEPGGWAIGGQLFGIDAETNQIAQELAQKLMKAHESKLT